MLTFFQQAVDEDEILLVYGETDSEAEEDNEPVTLSEAQYVINPLSKLFLMQHL